MVDTVTETFSSDTYYISRQTIDCAKTGYKPIGIVGYSKTSGINYTFPELYISGNRVVVSIAETDRNTWAANQTVTVYVLYEKL